MSPNIPCPLGWQRTVMRRRAATALFLAAAFTGGALGAPAGAQVPTSPYSNVLYSLSGWSESEIDTLNSIAKVDEAVMVVEAAGQQLTVGIVARSGVLPADLSREVLGTVIDITESEPEHPSSDRRETATRSAEDKAAGQLPVGVELDGSPLRSQVGDDTAVLERARVMAEKGVLRFQTIVLSDGQEVPRPYRQYVLKDEASLSPSSRPQSSQDTVSASASCSGYWWPSWITAKAGKSSIEGRRFGVTHFEWSASRLANLKCHNDVTFEPDFVTYNYDGRHYFDKSITAWSTTMPSGYKDTQFADSNNEWVFTVGTSDAKKLAADTTYRTYFRTAYGNYSSDTAKLTLQRGNRTPTWCHSTWCIFAAATKRVPSEGWFSIPVISLTYML